MINKNAIDLLYREIDLRKIKIYEYNFKTCNAVTFFYDGYYRIGIKKYIPSTEKFWLLEHELEHIKSGKMYHVNDDAFIINQAEREANNRMMAKSRMATQIYEALLKGYSKAEICSMYNLPSDVFDCSIQYIKRNVLMHAYNYFKVK